MNGYIVVAVCNFDDVIWLVTLDRKTAMKEARRVAKKPELRFEVTRQATDTEFLFARVYSFSRGKLQEIVAEYGPGGKRMKAS